MYIHTYVLNIREAPSDDMGDMNEMDTDEMK